MTQYSDFDMDGTAHYLGISQNRIRFCIFGILLAFFILAIRILELNLMTKEDLHAAYNSSSKSSFGLKRLNITDRNGNILATNISTASLYANPQEVAEPNVAAAKIAQIIGAANKEELETRLSANDKQFVWLKRHASPMEQQLIYDLGMPGIYFAADERRVYPQSNLFSHVLGFVDIDGNGLAGVERHFQNQLSTGGISSDRLILSLDMRVQNAVHEKLTAAIELHKAVGGCGIVMDVDTGEVLAMVSLPDFDLHKVDKAESRQRFNQATLGAFEMGSTMKLATVAVGLDTDTININDAFDVSQPLKIGRYTVHDYKGKGGSLSVPEILIYSSNLGVAQIVTKFGQDMQKKYLRDFGMLSKVNLEIPEIGSPIYPESSMWREASMLTISYGHGIAITPLNVIRAVASMVNGGVLIQPTLIKKSDQFTKPQGQQVIKKSTSDMMRKLMYMITKYGSGKKARAKGYYVGGKTGTSEKVVNGRYSKTANLASFVGAFPIYDPKYAVLVIVDEAKPNAINGGYTTGGMIAGPVVAEIVKQIGPILNIQPINIDEDDNIIEASLDVDFRPRHNPNLKNSG